MQITNKMGASADKLSWRVECRRILLFISAIFQVGAWDPGRCYIVLHYGTFSGSNRFSYWQLRGFRVNRFRISPPEMPIVQFKTTSIQSHSLPWKWPLGHMVIYLSFTRMFLYYGSSTSAQELRTRLVARSTFPNFNNSFILDLHDKIHISNVKIDITFSWAQFWVAARKGTFSGDKWGIEN